jgi:hypothetical protein
MSGHPRLHKAYQKYLAYTAASAVLGLVMIAGVNLTIDPANLLLDGENERAIAIAMNDGLNVQGTSDLDGLALQLHRVALMDAAPNVIVIGSSRAMSIRDGFMPGRLVNNSVSSAGLSQYCTIVRAYMQRKLLSGKMLLAVDPWLFNAGTQNQEDTDIPAGCEPFSPEGVNRPIAAAVTRTHAKAFEFISLGYLQASMTRVRYHGANAVSPYWRRLSVRYEATVDLPLVEGGWLSDGSNLYPEAARRVAGEELRQNAMSYALQTPVYNLGEYRQLNPLYVHIFERMLDALAARGVKVSFVLPPYHLVTAKALFANPIYGPIITKAETYMRALAAKRNTPIYGGYFSERCGAEEFYDGMHPRQACMAKLLHVKVPAKYSSIDQF